MKITVSFFGPIRRPWTEQTREVDVPDGISPRVFLDSLGFSAEDMQVVAIVVNGRRRNLDAELAEGDDVRFMLLAGGG